MLEGMLAGVRVVEFGYAWAGPLVGRMLGDLGADVIKLEQDNARGGHLPDDLALRAALDDWRRGEAVEPTLRASVFPEGEPQPDPWNRAGIFNKLNRNKRGLCADLKTLSGKRIWRRLVETSDVIVDNFSPRGSKSLGIDYETISQWNPEIISVSCTGYGHTGPFRQRVSYGPVLEAHAGGASVTGYADGGPMKMGHAFPDPIGGLHGTFAVLAALWEREDTGRGCFVDLSQLQTYAAVQGDLILETSLQGQAPARGNRSRSCAPQGVYRCRDESPDARESLDMWIAITIEDDDAWARFRQLVGDQRLNAPRFTDLTGRFEHHDELDSLINEWTRDRDRFELAGQLQKAEITALPVMTNGDLVESRQLRERGFIVEWDQPGVGVYEYGGFPIHFSDCGPAEMRPAPGLGGDNRRICEDLGFSAEEIDEFIEDGTLVNIPPVGASR
ncbi:MAG: CoA transferase [Chloroflexota bacterium]|nr:CoA transferase [Chloroflexota bacterium]